MEYFTPSPKKGSESKAKTISRRAFVLTSFKFVFLATIISRLFYLQVVKKDEFLTKSDKNRFRSWKITPSRGVILDRENNVIADNFQVYKIAIIPKEINSISSFFSSITKIIDLSEDEIQFYKKQISKNNKYQPFVFNKNLNWKEFSKLNYNIKDLPGVQPFISYERTYLYPNEFSHILGYVSVPNKNDLNKLNDNYWGCSKFKNWKNWIREKI